MAKVKTHFVCQDCGANTAQWSGKCFECGAWNSLVEFKEAKLPGASKRSVAVGTSVVGVKTLDLFANKEQQNRTSSGFSEVDRVLGGGFLQNSILLLGGIPGIGKSTLLLQIAGKLAGSKKCLIVSGEESGVQVAERAKRLGLGLEKIEFLSTNDLDLTLQQLQNDKPEFIIIDSVQTLASSSLESSAGTVSQIREVTQRLMEYAKSNNSVVVLVGHVTKEGSLAGPKLLEHMVDAVFYFENLNEGALRILRTQKNRFGSANESAVFEMNQEGLVEVLNPSAQFLAERQSNASGTSVAALVDGTRCFLVEVQALVQKCFHGFPRRTFQGIDQNRVALLMAVLEKYGIDFSNYDVYVKVAAGARIDEAAADLAIAAALASARLDRSLPNDILLIGELSLTGGVRSAQHVDIRIQEAARMGFKNFVISEQARVSSSVQGKNTIKRIKNISQLKELLWSGPMRSAETSL
ncbi:MAG: DNA repair protein RadA [Bdellovibrionota bacterium]